MRTTAKKNGITVKTYAGSTGVLLAFNVTDAKRNGLLGFAIERKHPTTKKWEWMTGTMRFAGQEFDAGTQIPTDLAPIQKFRWSDYRVYGGEKYRYRIHGRYGKPTDEVPQLLEGPEVEVTTASVDATGTHAVLFNRAAGSSQAFSRKYPKAVSLIEARRREGKLEQLSVDELEQVDRGCKDWLSRGILAQIVGLVEEAKDGGWALDIAIYEYEWHEIVDAVNAAADRGVEIRLIYHAREGDRQTAQNEGNLGKLIASGKAWPRVTKAIFHDKFIVLSKVSKAGESIHRTPLTVLGGSTNFTENGLFRQANVVHVIRKAKGEKTNATAEQYEKVFEMLWNGSGEAVTTPTVTKKWITANNPMDPTNPLFAGFSPRSGEGDLDEFVSIIGAATQDVLFSTAFVLPERIVAALLGKPNDPILRLGVQDKDSNKIAGFHRDRTANFAATALVEQGIEGWMLPEVRTGGEGSLLIHTKAVVVDFTTDSPVVVSGSHNLSGSASTKNDENYLIIRESTDLADCYGVEIMRIYDHYRARWVQDQVAKGKFAANGILRSNDKWTDRYFQPGSLHQSDRLRFIGS